MTVLLFLLLFGVQVFGRGLCPEKCVCLLDQKGRKMVLCENGGLRDSIPIAEMDRDVEVIRIRAPPNVLNSLTIGPIFQKFSRLEELKVVRSNIPAIGMHTFLELPTLRVLDLSWNNISYLLESNFKGLENLTNLHLNNNKIDSMPSETFKHLHRLEVLTLAGNEINGLAPRIFLKLGKLLDLDLSDNPLTSLNPKVFKDTPNLKFLKCRLCRLVKIDVLLHHFLPNLVELDLGQNQITFIHSKAFDVHTNLQVLRLDGNLVSEIDDSTFGIEKGGRQNLTLHFVDLSWNRLIKVSSHALVNLKALRTFNLSYNQLNRLHNETFSFLGDSLLDLDLSGNRLSIEDLKYVAESVPGLNRLSLADMQLTDLPLGTFAHHENLRFLNLSGNRFSHISPQVLHLLTRVKTLDLSKNRFQGFTEKVLVVLEKIPNLLLKGNLWACDLCHIPSILNRANNSVMRAVFEEETCQTPKSVMGIPVLFLRGDQLSWCASSGPEDAKLGVLGGPLDTGNSRAPLLALVTSVSFALALATALAAAACVFYLRRRSAYYYTREESRTTTEVTIGQSFEKIHENGNSALVPPKKALLNDIQKVSIAVIDELGKDSDLEMLTNGV